MKHVIVGAGPAGVIAAETLRTTDPDAHIVLIGDEPEPPYSRMAIPYWLAEDIDEAGTYLRHQPDHWDRLRIELLQDRVASLDPDTRSLLTAGGNSLEWDKLLLATGSKTIRPPITGMDLAGVENCWTLNDARRIAARARPGARVTLMGAGFIGCIVLEALAARGVDLTVVEMENRMVPRMMDGVGGELLKKWCEQRGVRVLTATRVESVESRGEALQLALADGQTLVTDLVVCATGVKPNTEFLKGTDVDTEHGILVDQHLQTSVADIYAAGDVAQGPIYGHPGREVQAIQPTASEHGRVAALSMAGNPLRYRGSLSMNVLNTLGLISSSFGLWMGVEGGDHVEALDKNEFRYLRLEFQDDVLVGAIALGLTQHVGVVRGLIQTQVPLGAWKQRLMADPHQVMEAYLECRANAVAA